MVNLWMYTEWDAKTRQGGLLGYGKTVLQELASLKLYIPSNAGGHPPPRGGAPKGGRKITGLLGRSNGRLP